MPAPQSFFASLEHWIAAQWQKRGVTAWLLWPLSWCFGVVAMLRRFAFRHGLFKATSVGVPVVVVGNVTVGGTGKTPTVIALVKALQAAGRHPGVVSRGYGGSAKAKTPLAVTAASDPVLVGDEPTLIARRTGIPVMVCPDRVAAVRALRAAHPEVDVVISDDGLQHYRLARDVEIVVFDQRLGGNGFLLPAGPLREPMTRKRDATLINDPFAHTPPPWPATWLIALAPQEAWSISDPAQRRPLTHFANQNVLAAAGIGSPERFFAMLRDFGIQPKTMPLPDHHRFDPAIFAQESVDAILVTEKDAVKCAGWHDARLWAVPVTAVLDPRLIALVVEKVCGRSPA